MAASWPCWGRHSNKATSHWSTEATCSGIWSAGQGFPQHTSKRRHRCSEDGMALHTATLVFFLCSDMQAVESLEGNENCSDWSVQLR